MLFNLQKDPHKLQVFYELYKRRYYVGELSYEPQKNIFQFTYDKNYTLSKKAIALGPELDLFKLTHTSSKLFDAFVDRIPEKSNPAYADYCLAQGISPEEQNPIILLSAIGHRGPSSFIFEPVYRSGFNVTDIKTIREQIGISQHDLAIAFDISQITLQRMENGSSDDLRTIKLLEIYFNFPQVALWQLKQTGTKIHTDALGKLTSFFRSQA